MVCVPLTTQAAKFSWAKNISSDLYCNDSTNLLSLATSANDVNSFHCEYQLNTPTVRWDYSHIVPLNQIEVTSETWTSIVYNLVVSGASGVIWDLHYVVHVLLIDSFLAPRVNFFPREPLDLLEISALTEWELKRFLEAFGAGAPRPLACLPHVHLFSPLPTTSKHLIRRLS